jgi:hypothetical protein
MHDDTNPTRPRPIQGTGFGSDAIYACVLVGVATGLLLVGAVVSPVIRLLVLLVILSCVGFFLAVVTTAYLGYLNVPSESPRTPSWIFMGGVGVGLTAFTVVFGIGWLAGFLVYVVSVVWVLILMERRRRIDGPDTF